MRRSVLAAFPVLILISLKVLGCATEETGASDWLKWNFNRESGLPLYEGNRVLLLPELVRRWRSIRRRSYLRPM